MRILFIAAFTFSCQDSGRSWDLRGVGTATHASPAPNPGGFRLKLGRSLGDAGGLSSFDAPKAIAASRQGLLAIFDAARCDISIADTVALRVRLRFGKCGDGPGELRAVSAMVFAADTLVAYDFGHRAFEEFTASGTHIRRVPFTAGLVGSMAPLDDSLILVAVARPGAITTLPDSDRSAVEKLVATVSITSGAIKRWFVADSRQSLANPAPRSRLVAICGAVGTTEPRVALESYWQFEGVTLRGQQLEPNAHFVVDLPWGGPRKVDGNPGFEPSISRITPACGSEAIWFRRAHAEESPTGLQLVGGRSEFRSYDGKLLLAQVSDSADTLRLIGRSAALGNSFYTIVDWEDVPRIQQFVLESSQLSSKMERNDAR